MPSKHSANLDINLCWTPASSSRDVGRFDRNGYGGNRVSAEDVPIEFFKPNNISEARQFNRLYGENSEVRQRMTDYALDDLRRTVVDPNSGMIKEGAVNKWLAKNERILNEMPWIREAVTGRNPDVHYQSAAHAGEPVDRIVVVAGRTDE